MIKEYDVTLRVAIDISTYDMGRSGKMVIPILHSVNEKKVMGTSLMPIDSYQVVKQEIFNTLENDDFDYNEAIKDAKEAVGDGSVRDEED